MAKRLTPNLRRRVLELPLSDRAALLAELMASIVIPDRVDQRLPYLADRLAGISGIDVRVCRRCDAASVWARNIFIFVARREGFLQREIGAVLNRDHSSVAVAEKRMADAFAQPGAYAKELKLYNQFIDAL